MPAFAFVQWNAPYTEANDLIAAACTVIAGNPQYSGTFQLAPGHGDMLHVCVALPSDGVNTLLCIHLTAYPGAIIGIVLPACTFLTATTSAPGAVAPSVQYQSYSQSATSLALRLTLNNDAGGRLLVTYFNQVSREICSVSSAVPSTLTLSLLLTVGGLLLVLVILQVLHIN